MTDTNKKPNDFSELPPGMWLDNAPEPLSTVEEVKALSASVRQLKKELAEPVLKKTSP